VTQAILPARTTRSGGLQSATGAIWSAPVLDATQTKLSVSVIAPLGCGYGIRDVARSVINLRGCLESLLSSDALR
jgi:hypothetical protein